MGWGVGVQVLGFSRARVYVVEDGNVQRGVGVTIFRVWGFGFRVQGLGLGDWGLVIRAPGAGESSVVQGSIGQCS